MADSFFGFDSSLGTAIDDGLDCLDDEEFVDENYDALNDETFGSEATAGDWEQDHEKLAQITESSRSRNRNDHSKSESEIDVESSLSHLVLDEKEVTIPRPGVWDCPTNFPIPPSQFPPKPSLSAAFKNVCTVEELERGLITSRPPPGLIKPPQQQHQNTSGGNPFLNSITSAGDKLLQLNSVNLPSNQFPMGLPPNLRLPPHPQFQLQNARPMPNPPGNMMFPNPPPRHMMPPPGGMRHPLHGNFPMNNFPPNPGMMPFMRPDHPMMPPHLNNHQMQQHHNMQMANQRNQSKPFNQNDRPDNHQPFFKNNQHHHQNFLNRYLNNYDNRGYHMNNHQYNHSPSNGIGPSGEIDEYAGLMNNREKQWLNNIQLLQLNRNQPYIDDYYYTVFCDRLNKKNENKNRNNKAAVNKKQVNSKGGTTNNNNNNNNGFHRDSRDRDQPQHTFTKAATTPMQFENSLGKLQYSSVTAPRKIIDMDVVPNSDPQSALSIQQKDTKKTRQLLLEIERLYILVLKLEDKSNPVAILADQQREQQLKEQQQQQQQEGGEPIPEPEHKDPVKEKEELVSSIMSTLLQFTLEDKFATLLSIRKGKTLFLRYISCLDVKENKFKLGKLWSAIIKGLALIGRRDPHLLTSFYIEFHRWVDENCISVSLLLSLANEFIEATNQPSKTNSLTFALTNKFGLSLIALMLKHAEELCSYDTVHESFAEQWPKFLTTVGESIGSILPIVAPCEPVDNDTLRTHLRRNKVDTEVFVSAFELFFTEANPAR